jgi:hypothetical protein
VVVYACETLSDALSSTAATHSCAFSAATSESATSDGRKPCAPERSFFPSAPTVIKDALQQFGRCVLEAAQPEMEAFPKLPKAAQAQIWADGFKGRAVFRVIRNQSTGNQCGVRIAAAAMTSK